MGYPCPRFDPGHDAAIDRGCDKRGRGRLCRGARQCRACGECVRCLDPITVPVEINAGELYMQTASSNRSRTRKSDEREDVEVEGDQLDPDYLIEQDSVDLEPLLRDALFGDVTLQPLCSEDCEGMCEHCGIRWRDAEPGHSHEFIDPRFASLQSLLDEDNG